MGHFALFPWKFICACVPPPTLCKGWACFTVALVVIGALTAVIGDLADMLGCALGIPKSITAVTIVALGTSLPDTFASKTAAVQEPTADASICNVTGSNSVNVFLGLGLPWMIGAFYWSFTPVDIEDPKDPWRLHGEEAGWFGDPELKVEKLYPGSFVVPAGSLGPSVTVFTITAIVSIAVLMLRRRSIDAELGGPNTLKWVSAGVMVLLWLIYIIYSIHLSLAEA